MWFISGFCMFSFAALGIILAISKGGAAAGVGGASEGFEARGTDLADGFIAAMLLPNAECLGELSGFTTGIGSTFYSGRFVFTDLGGNNIRYKDPKLCYPGYVTAEPGNRRSLKSATSPSPETSWEPTSVHYQTMELEDEVRIRGENYAARVLAYGDYGKKHDPALVSELNYEVPYNSKKGMSLLFEPDAGQSLWTLEAVKGMCKVDATIQANVKGWKSTLCELYPGVTPATCQPSRSLGNYIAALSGAASCAAITQTDMDTVMDTLKMCRPAYDNLGLKPNCWNWNASPAGAYTPKQYIGEEYPSCDLDVSLQVCAKYNAVFDIFSALTQKGWLKDGSDGPLTDAQLITFNKGSDQVLETLRDGWTETVFPMLGETFGGATFISGAPYLRYRNWLFNTQIADDKDAVIIIFVIVYCLILFHSGSFWIASCAFFQIFMAFFWGYTFYQIFMWKTFFPFLNLISIFLIIGIGSDDVFVYIDAWKQSFSLLPRNCPLANRLSWVMRRAGGAMFVTTITTSVSFLANLASPITALKGFGLFTSLVIVSDYLLMILFLPATVAVYYTTFSLPAGKHQMRLQRNPDWALTNLLCCPLAITYDDCENQEHVACDDVAVADSAPPQIEMTKVSAAAPGASKIMDRATDVPTGDNFLEDIKHADSDNCQCLNCCCCITRLDIDNCAIPTEVNPKTGKLKSRWAEDFFEFYFAPFVLHKYLKYLLIAVTLTVAIILSFSAVKLSKPHSDYLQLLDKDHYLEKLDGFHINKFDIGRGESRQYTYEIFYGLAKVDNGDKMNPWERGSPEYLPLDISSPAAQQYLYDVCTNFQNWDDTPVSTWYFGKPVCGIRWFREWMESPCGTTTNTAVGGANNYVVEPQRTTCCSKTTADFPYAASEFGSCLATFSNYWASKRKNHGFFYDEKGQLKVVTMTAPTLTKFSYVFGISDTFFHSLMKVWNALPSAPVGTGLENGFINSNLQFYALQEAIADGAINSAILSTVFALVVLVVLSRTLLASILSGIHIACCVLTVTGIAVLLGWELNVMESVIFSLSVGLCCDFAAHLSHAFNQVIDDHVTDTKVPLTFPRSWAELKEHTDLSHIKAVIAIRELSVPIFMGFWSTFLAGVMLLSGSLFFFQQFGTFLALIMVCSLLTAFCFLMPMLASIGWVDRLITHTTTEWYGQMKAKYYNSVEKNGMKRVNTSDKPNVVIPTEDIDDVTPAEEANPTGTL